VYIFVSRIIYFRDVFQPKCLVHFPFAHARYLPARPSRPNSLTQPNIIVRTTLYALSFLKTYICTLTWIYFDVQTTLRHGLSVPPQCKYLLIYLKALLVCFRKENAFPGHCRSLSIFGNFNAVNSMKDGCCTFVGKAYATWGPMVVNILFCDR
jgi:hypothetical protein